MAPRALKHQKMKKVMTLKNENRTVVGRNGKQKVAVQYIYSCSKERMCTEGGEFAI